MKYNITLGLALVCVMLFTTCDNIIDAPKTGYGRISINVTTDESPMARTVLPSTVFTHYEYTFTKAGETDGVIETPDADGFFSLEFGNYTVAVQAFIGNADSYILAAAGISSEFYVESGSNDPVAVYLSAVDIAGEEDGEFVYTIMYPADALVLITLVKWPDNAEITLNPTNVDEGNGISETLQLDAGFYLLTILISKNDLYAGISEAIHISPLLTTIYRKDFENSDLIDARIPLSTDYDISGVDTFVYDGSERIAGIVPKENVSTGAITVYYEGTDGTAYEKSTAAPVDVGTYTVTFDVEAVRSWSAATGLPAGVITIDARFWDISLSEVDTYTFPTVGEGYETQAARTITVTNTGNVATGVLAVALSGTNENDFALSTASPGSINSPNGTVTFNISPKTGLAIGIYTVTVTVFGENDISEQFNVSFTVEDAQYDISLSPSTYSSSAYQGYAQQAGRTVTVTNTGNLPTGTLSVTQSGTNAGSFTVSDSWLSSLPAGSDTTFTVRPNTGLKEGTYTAAITVSGSNDISANFNVSFTVNIITSIADVTSYLASVSGGQNPDDLVPLPVVFDLGIMTSSASNWQLLLEAIRTGDKFVALDLSACTMSGGVAFDAVSSVSTGKAYIVSMVLPTVAQSIASSSGINFSYLRSVSAENVTSIAGSTWNTNYAAFYGCTSLTSVSFPQVTTIEGYVFYGCTNLTSVSIPAATTIDTYAFSGCTSLASVNFPQVTTIEGYAFYGCTSLTSVTLPKATSIPSGAFNNCTSLTTITNTNFPVATSIGSAAFSGCISLQSVSFPSVTSIAGSTWNSSYGAFYNCTALTSVSFPQVTTIDGYVFYGCINLTSVSIPVATTIGTYTFSGCTSLTTVNFPEVATIDSYIFNGCTSLSSVTLPKVIGISSGAFNNCTSLTTITNTNFPVATSIGSAAFSGCTSLRSVSFPSVTNVAGSTWNSSSGAFYNCTSLTSVTLPQITTIEGFVFSNTGTTTLTLTMNINVPPSVGVNIFNGVNAGKMVVVKRPSGATSLYGSSPTDTTTNNWGNALRGKGWSQNGDSYGSGTVNSNVTVIIENL